MDKLNGAIDKLIEYLPQDMNILKTIEECTELNEVLIKYLTKSEEYKPPIEKIVEEMGDTVFRILVLSRLLEIEDEVEGRVEEKASLIYDWVLGKFENLKN